MKADTEQANEHGDKQDDVGSERGNDARSGALNVGPHANAQQRYLCAAELWMN